MVAAFIPDLLRLHTDGVVAWDAARQAEVRYHYQVIELF